MALSIAGADSSGGSGLSRDLAAFAAEGVPGRAVATAVTAQGGVGVLRADPVDPELVRLQIETALEDGAVRAAKTGMLATAPIVEAVARTWARLGAGRPLVVDPVLAATSGAELLDEAGRSTLIELLLPLADVITPNREEAGVLTGLGAEAAARDLAGSLAERMQPGSAVLITGWTGSGDQRVADLLWHGGELQTLEHERVPTARSRGTGCQLSATLAAGLARDPDSDLGALVAHAQARVRLRLGADAP